MRLFCSLGWHRPSSRVIPNEGRLFSRCTACSADIIMVGRSWRKAPRGYQVIWKEAEPAPVPEAPPEPEKKPRKSATARRRGERRAAASKELPEKLGGKERRRSDRRKGFGKKPDAED